MFPQVPVQGIHIISGESAIGTHKGFPCMHLSNGSITPILRDCDFVTLGANILYFFPTLIRISSSPGVSPLSLLEMAMALWLSDPLKLVVVLLVDSCVDRPQQLG